MTNLKNLLARAGIAIAVTGITAVPVFAADGPDFSGIYAGIAVGGLVVAMVAQGGLKALPNFARWGANKVAGFFR
ncbi:hypothetical protein [Pseudomonas tohonis]|uniref:hypothetical protein n=1 Tax=Pseudomonas tohonis TaxID=2725477 RepID=UPI001F333FD5|nr:hypothetical protein [Pseudomonas tohonis]GJN48261.1 hypothetical protein TUM20249_42470 [Pseudomonas tohonis]